MPQKELERLQTVNRFLKLQISKAAELQKIVEQAASLCAAPIAMITIMEDQVQHVKFRIGTSIKQLSYERSFCQKTIAQEEVFVVENAANDAYFSDNPYVKHKPNIGFYAGAPLRTSDGNAIGTVCVYDIQARSLSMIQRRMLKSLSKQIIHLLEFEASLQLLRDQYIDSRKMAITLRSFFESSSSNHVLLDREMCIVAFNKPFDDFTFATRGRHLKLGTPLIEYLHPDFRFDYSIAFKKALNGLKIHLEKDLMYQDRRICWYMNFEPAYDREGQIIGVSFNRINITSRVEQEERVRKQQESLHKIRNVELNDLEKPVTEIVRLMKDIECEALPSRLEEFQLLKVAIQELQEKLVL